MTLSQCLKELKHDINNGGLEDDTFAMNCYVTMANKARRLLENGTSDKQAADVAREYLAVCFDSSSDTLRYIAARQ
jgi:hypothetical protein